MTERASKIHTRASRWEATLVLLLAAGAFSACGADDSSPSARGIGDDDGNASGGVSGTAGAATSGGTTGVAGSGNGMPNGGSSMTGGTGPVTPEPPEPEVEIESAFETPVATNRYVWSANPDSGNVAYIDAETLVVRLTEAGFRPTTVAALPSGEDEDRAIVLNEGSADATILSVRDGILERETLETHQLANAVEVSPSGEWAVAWSNAARFQAAGLDPTDGLQDVTVLHFGDELFSTRLSVGFRPSRVMFDEAERRVLVVTEPGLSVIELGGDPRVTALVELSENPVLDQTARDVSVTPDGELALVRLDGDMQLHFVEVASGRRSAVNLGDFVTDLDLSHDGELAFAMIGSGDQSTLVVIPVAERSNVDAFEQASLSNVVSRSVSLSENDELALLYSNAAPNPYLTVFTSDGSWAEHQGWSLDLKAPVLAVFAAPNGRHGIAFQETLPQSTKRGAFSLISAQVDRAPKIIGTDAPPTSVAFSPDGEVAVIATRDLGSARYGAYLVRLEHLDEVLIPLLSPPLAAGVVPNARRAYVAQAHQEGRVTFIDLDSGEFTTLTGFELSGRVVE